jgi:hypothetical protein
MRLFSLPCLSACVQGQLKGFAKSFIILVFSEIYRHIIVLINSDKSNEHFIFRSTSPIFLSTYLAKLRKPMDNFPVYFSEEKCFEQNISKECTFTISF